MGRKFRDLIMMLLAAGGCLALTMIVAKGNYGLGTLCYNLAFWGIIVLLYLAALFAGFFRIVNISDSFFRSGQVLDRLKESQDITVGQKLSMLGKEFILKKELDDFAQDYDASRSGICDIEDYINEDELDRLCHRRLLELLPDIMTSLGVLGTFMGLVWGLRNFQPSDYEAITASVSSLVEGIKIAFLTSIYGLSMSLIFSYSLKSNYNRMLDQMQQFLDRFHSTVVPSAQMETQNLLLESQREQTEILKDLVSQFSDQVAKGFAESLTPTLERINLSLGGMMNTITHNQQAFMQEIVQQFLAEMNASFAGEFREFEQQLQAVNESMSRTVAYNEKLYREMTESMQGLFLKQEADLHTGISQLSAMQQKYAASVDHLAEKYEEITVGYQKAQETALKNLSASSEEASRFWVACNQTMQNYLQEAANAYANFEKSYQTSDKLLTAMIAIYQKNGTLIEQQESHLKAYEEVQKQMQAGIDQFGRFLNGIEEATQYEKKILMSYTNPDEVAKSTDQLMAPIVRALEYSGTQQARVLEEYTERQQDLIEDLRRAVKNVNTAQASKKKGFSLFSQKGE